MLAATIRSVVSWQAASAPNSTSPDLHETSGTDPGTTAQCSGSLRSLGPLRTRSRIWAVWGSRLYRSRIGACNSRRLTLVLVTLSPISFGSVIDGTLGTHPR